MARRGRWVRRSAVGGAGRGFDTGRPGGEDSGDVVIADDGPVSGWLADGRLADVREPGLRGRWDGLNPWGARDVGTRDYSPSPAQLTRLAVLGLLPVQVARSGGSVYEALVRSAPERVGGWLGFEGDLLAGDMRDVVVEVGSRLAEAFRADYLRSPESYAFLGSEGSEQREAGVARLERYLGTGGVWAVAEAPGGEGVVADGDVGGVLLGLVARFIGLGVEVIREDGAIHVLSRPAADGELVRLVRVNHPKVHYLGTRSAGEALLGMSIDRLADLSSSVDADPVWDDARPPLRDLLSRLVGSEEASRLRARLVVLVESVRQWDQALQDAPYFDDVEALAGSDYAVGGAAVAAFARRWAYEALRAFIDRHADYDAAAVIVPVRAGVIDVEGTSVRLTDRPVDGLVRLAPFAEGGLAGWEVFGHQESVAQTVSGEPPMPGSWLVPVVSPHRLGVLTITGAGRRRVSRMVWDDGELGEMFVAGDVVSQLDGAGGLEFLGTVVPVQASRRNQGVVLRRDQSQIRRVLVLSGVDDELLGVLVFDDDAGQFEVRFERARAGLAGVFAGASAALRAVVFDGDWVALGPYRARVEGMSGRRPSWVPVGVGWELPDVWWRWNPVLYPTTAALIDRGNDSFLGQAGLDEGWELRFLLPEHPAVPEDELAELVEVWGNPAGDGLTLWVRGSWDVEHDRESVRNIVVPSGTVLVIGHSVDGTIDILDGRSKNRGIREAGLLSLLRGLVADRRLVAQVCFAALGGADALTQRWAKALRARALGPASLVVDIKYTGHVYASDEFGLAFSDWPSWPLPGRGAHVSVPAGYVPVPMDQEWFWNTEAPVDPMVDRLWGGSGSWHLPDASVRNLGRFLTRPGVGVGVDPTTVVDVFVQGIADDPDRVMVEVEEHHSKVKKMMPMRGRHLATTVLEGRRSVGAIRLHSMIPDGQILPSRALSWALGPVGSGVAVEVARRLGGWVDYSNGLTDIGAGAVQLAPPHGVGLRRYAVRVVPDSGGRVVQALRAGANEQGIAFVDPDEDVVDRLAQLQPDEDGSFVVLVGGALSEDGLLLVPGADGRGWFGVTPAQLAAILPTQGLIEIVPTSDPDPRLADFVGVVQLIRGVDHPVQYTAAATSITADGALRQGDDVPTWDTIETDALPASGKRLWLIPSDASPQAVLRRGFEAGESAMVSEVGVSEVDILAVLALRTEARLYVALASDDEPIDGSELSDEVSGTDVLGYLRLQHRGGQVTVHTFVSLPGAVAGIRGARPHVPDRLFGQLLMLSTRPIADTFALVASDASRGLASGLPAVAVGSRRVRYVAHLATQGGTPTVQVDLINGKLHEPTVAGIVTELEGRAHSAGRPLELVLLSDPTANPRQLADAQHLIQWKAERAGTGRTLIRVATQTSSGQMQIIEPSRLALTGGEPGADRTAQGTHAALPTRRRPREDDDQGPAPRRPRLTRQTAPRLEPLDEDTGDSEDEPDDVTEDDADYAPGGEDGAEFEDEDDEGFEDVGWVDGDRDVRASTSGSDGEGEPASDQEDLLPVDPLRRLPAYVPGGPRIPAGRYEIAFSPRRRTFDFPGTTFVVPAGLPLAVLEVYVTEQGWFIITHPSAGDTIASGWLPGLAPEDAIESAHPAYEATVVAGQTIAHPSQPGLRTYLNAAAGSRVSMRTDSDGMVTATDSAGNLLVRRLLENLGTGAAPDDELGEVVATVPAEVVATRTARLVGGYVDSGQGFVPAGRPSGGADIVGVWDDGEGRQYYDLETRVVLARQLPTTMPFPKPPSRIGRAVLGPGWHALPVRSQHLVAYGRKRFVIPPHLRSGNATVDLFVSDDGWFVITHSETGEWIASAHTARSRLTDVERAELAQAWQEAGHDGDVVLRPTVGELPPRMLPGDVLDDDGKQRIAGFVLPFASGVKGRVLLSPSRGWAAIIDKDTGLVTRIFAISRPAPLSRLVHSPYPARVGPGGSVALVGPDGLRVFTGLAWPAHVVARSDPDGWVRVHTLAGKTVGGRPVPGGLLVEQRWSSVRDGLVLADETVVRQIPIGLDQDLVAVDEFGYITAEQGLVLIGRRYRDQQVARWVDDDGSVMYYHPVSGLVLTMEVPGDPTSYAAPPATRWTYRPGRGKLPIQSKKRLVFFAGWPRLLRVGLRVEGVSAERYVTREGWFVVTHPDNGEWLMSGRLPGTPLSDVERDELDRAWAEAEYEGEVILWPTVGQPPPPQIAGDVMSRVLRGSEHTQPVRVGDFQVNLAPHVARQKVLVSPLRGWAAVIDADTDKVLRIKAVARPDPIGRLVHPEFEPRVLPGQTVTLAGPEKLQVYVGGHRDVVMRSDLDGFVTVRAKDRDRTLLVHQRYSSLRSGVVLPDEVVVRQVSDVTGTATVNSLGYVVTEHGHVLIGEHRAWGVVGTWIDDDGGVNYVDPLSKLVLAHAMPGVPESFAEPPVTPWRKWPAGRRSLTVRHTVEIKFARSRFVVRPGRRVEGVSAEVVVTEDGWFAITYGDTGEEIAAGWLPYTPLTPWEKSAMALAWQRAGHRGPVVYEAVKGEAPPPAMDGDIWKTRQGSEGKGKTLSVWVDNVCVLLPRGLREARVLLSRQRGWAAVVDPRTNMVVKVQAVARHDRPGQLVHPLAERRVVVKGATLALGEPEDPRVYVGDSADPATGQRYYDPDEPYLDVRIDPEGWVSVQARTPDRRLLVHQRLTSIKAGVVLDDEIVVRRLSPDSATQTVDVDSFGYVSSGSVPVLVGAYRAGQQVGMLIDGKSDNQKTVYLDEHSGVVLAHATPGEQAGEVHEPRRAWGKYTVGRHLLTVTARERRLIFANTRQFLRPGLRADNIELVLWVTDSGWFVITHPDTGEWLLSGWLVGTRLSPVELQELRRAWAKARLEGDPEKRPRWGEQPPPALPGDHDETTEESGPTRIAGVGVNLPKEPTVKRVLISWQRGWLAIIDPSANSVIRVIDVIRPDPPGRRVHPPVSPEVVPGATIALGGWGDPRAYVGGFALGTVRSDLDGWVTVVADDGTLLRRQRWSSLDAGIVRDDEIVVARVAPDAQATIVKVDGFGYIPGAAGQVLIGFWYRDKTVARTVAGDGAVLYSSQESGLVLAREVPGDPASYAQPPIKSWQPELRKIPVTKQSQYSLGNRKLRVPARLRREPHLDRFVSDLGYFFVAHQDTGEWLLSGWMPGAPLTEVELAEVRQAWQDAGHEGEAVLRPTEGQPPPLRLDGDRPSGPITVARPSFHTYRIDVPESMRDDGVTLLLSPLRGWVALINLKTGLVGHVVDIVRPETTPRLTHPRVPVRVMPDRDPGGGDPAPTGVVTLIGPDRLRVRVGGEAVWDRWAVVSSDGEWVTVEALAGYSSSGQPIPGGELVHQRWSSVRAGVVLGDETVVGVGPPPEPAPEASNRSPWPGQGVAAGGVAARGAALRGRRGRVRRVVRSQVEEESSTSTSGSDSEDGGAAQAAGVSRVGRGGRRGPRGRAGGARGASRGGAGRSGRASRVGAVRGGGVSRAGASGASAAVSARSGRVGRRAAAVVASGEFVGWTLEDGFVIPGEGPLFGYLSPDSSQFVSINSTTSAVVRRFQRDWRGLPGRWVVVESDSGSEAEPTRSAQGREAVLVGEFGSDGAELLLMDAADVVRRVGLGVAAGTDLAVAYPVLASMGEQRSRLTPAQEIGLIVGDASVLLDVAEALRFDYDAAVQIAREFARQLRGPGAFEPPDTEPMLNRVLAVQAAVLDDAGRYAAWTPPDGDCWFNTMIRSAKDVVEPTPQIALLARMVPLELRRHLLGRLDDSPQVSTRLAEVAGSIEEYQAFREMLVRPRQWTHFLFNGFFEVAPDLLGVRALVLNPDGSETELGPEGGSVLRLVRPGNHYMPGLRKHGLVRPVGSFVEVPLSGAGDGVWLFHRGGVWYLWAGIGPSQAVMDGVAAPVGAVVVHAHGAAEGGLGRFADGIRVGMAAAKAGQAGAGEAGVGGVRAGGASLAVLLACAQTQAEAFRDEHDIEVGASDAFVFVNELDGSVFVGQGEVDANGKLTAALAAPTPFWRYPKGRSQPRVPFDPPPVTVLTAAQAMAHPGRWRRRSAVGEAAPREELSEEAATAYPGRLRPPLDTGRPSEDSRRVVDGSPLPSLPEGATVVWPADARRVKDVIGDRGRLGGYGSPTGELGPGHYTLANAELALRHATEVDIGFPALVELRLRRAANGLRVNDTATTEDTTAEQLGAVLDEYDFLASPDGELLKFHPRLLDFVDVVRVSFGTDGLWWVAPEEFVAGLVQSMVYHLMARLPGADRPAQDVRRNGADAAGSRVRRALRCGGRAEAEILPGRPAGTGALLREAGGVP